MSQANPVESAGPNQLGRSLAFPQELDASCRWVCVFQSVLAGGWLVLGLVLFTLSYAKMNAPGLLAQLDWMPFGRLYAGAWSAILYGFTVPAGLTVGLWMTARMCQTPLFGGSAALLGSILWQTGLLYGISRLLSGHNTGLMGLETPVEAMLVLLVGFVVQASCLLVTFFRCTNAETSVPQWFVLGSVFTFAWAGSAAIWLGGIHPLRGVLSVSVAVWFRSVFFGGWVQGIALGCLFYLLPKSSGVAIPGRSLAMLSFWSVLGLNGFTGLVEYVNGPFPAWMTTLSLAVGVLQWVVPVSVALNLWPMWKAVPPALRAHPLHRQWLLGSIALLFGAALLFLTAIPPVASRVQFTLIRTAVEALMLFGALGQLVLSCLSFALPRVLQVSPVPELWQKVWGWIWVTGSWVVFLSLASGGVVQAVLWPDTAVPAFAVAKKLSVCFSGATLGFLILTLGALVWLAGMLGLVLQWFRGFWAEFFQAWCVPSKMGENSP
jgi:cytochrome c oxidase cbb3-type subunit 1